MSCERAICLTQARVTVITIEKPEYRGCEVTESRADRGRDRRLLFHVKTFILPEEHPGNKLPREAIINITM